MKTIKTLTFAAISALTLSACGGSGGSGDGARDFVRAVGSSTVYPFATAVAEEVAKAGGKSPVIESTGTGAGMKLFCAGVGYAHPDIEDASRRMKASEYEDCVKNGVTEVVEIQVGIDGIAFAEAKEGPNMKLTPVDVYKAIAANPDNLLARSYMGQGMVAEGRIDDAITQWREIKARGGEGTWAEASLREAIRTGSTYSY